MYVNGGRNNRFPENRRSVDGGPGTGLMECRRARKGPPFGSETGTVQKESSGGQAEVG